jgi:hypothetical protein
MAPTNSIKTLPNRSYQTTAAHNQWLLTYLAHDQQAEITRFPLRKRSKVEVPFILAKNMRVRNLLLFHHLKKLQIKLLLYRNLWQWNSLSPELEVYHQCLSWWLLHQIKLGQIKFSAWNQSSLMYQPNNHLRLEHLPTNKSKIRRLQPQLNQ